MKYKKKGSSLLITVCMFAVLSIIIVSIMAMTTSGFKLRKDESKRIESFYGADSGLEIAYVEIEKVINKAIEVGNKLVADITDGITNVDSDNQVVNKTEKEWEDKVFKRAYEKYILENLEKAVDNVDVTPTSLIYKPYIRNGKEIKVDAKIVSGQKNTWELISNFIDKDNKERIVSVNYQIKVPDYGVQFATGESHLLNFLMGADGNMYVENNSAFNVLGDIWVKGDKDSVKQKANYGLEDKYLGGITMTSIDQGNITMHGDLVTGGTLRFDNVKFDTVASANKNKYEMFADNIIYRNNIGKGSQIPDYDFYAYNDLLFDANSSLTIGNYYGLNDINIYEKPTTNSYNKDLEKWDRSSSVIINNQNNSALNIYGDMVIAGTTYLDLKGEAYQSGESVILNKSAKPYTQRDKPFIYDYRDPLHLMNRELDESELTLEKKITIANEYYEENKVEGGLNAKKIYSVGAVLGKETKDISNLKGGLESKQMEYANRVFNMTNDLSSESEKSNDINLFWNKKNENSVATSINVDGIQNIINKDKIEKESKEVLIRKFKNDENNFAFFKEGKDFKQGSYNRINLILNNSGKKIIIDKNLVDATGVGRVKFEDDCIRVGLDYANKDTKETVPIIIISTSDIDIIAKTNEYWDIRGLFYTFEDLNIEIPAGTASMNFGNYGHELNKMFKDFLSETGLGSEIGGNVIIPTKNKFIENVINASDFIESKNWKLVK